MREIKAIIRQERLDGVLDALHQMPELPGVTVSWVRGVGKRRSSAPTPPEQYGEGDMVKIEVVVPTELAPVVVDTIRRTATTGRPGDGKIFIAAIEDAIRIRNGESGVVALS